MYLKRLDIDFSTRILHIAPELGLYRNLTEIAPDNYIPCDFQPSRYLFAKDCKKIDLCHMEDWPSEEFDLILHIHVLEHIPCTIAYPLFHLHRMLKPTGTHLCIIPFMNGKYDECFQDISEQERTRRFGQFDHVRKFGADDISMHLGKVINLPLSFNALETFSELDLVDANIPKSHWEGFHIGTVLSLKKNDYKLQSFH